MLTQNQVDHLLGNENNRHIMHKIIWKISRVTDYDQNDYNDIANISKTSKTKLKKYAIPIKDYVGNVYPFAYWWETSNTRDDHSRKKRHAHNYRKSLGILLPIDF